MRHRAGRGIQRFYLAGLTAISLLTAMPSAMAVEQQDVWLSSDDNTPDMLDLFRHPELWARARERVGVFKFAPHHVTSGITGCATPISR
jgi:hypothetical protein